MDDSGGKGEFVLSTDPLTGALGGVVEAHNGLAKRFRESLQQVESTRGECVKAIEEISKLAARQEELTNGQTQQAKRSDELTEAIGAERDQRQAALRELDETLRTRIGATEISLEGLTAKHGEIVGVILPKCQADLKALAEKLQVEIKSLREEMFTQSAAAKLTARQEDLYAEQSRQSDVLRGQITEARNAIIELRQHVDSVDQARLKAFREVEETLRPRLHAAEKSLEDVVAEHAKLVSIALPRCRSDLGLDIYKLQQEVELLDQKTRTRDEERQAAWKQEAARLAESSAKGQTQLSAEVGVLRAGLAVAEDANSRAISLAEAAAEKLTVVGDELRVSIRSEASRLEKTGEKATSNAVEEVLRKGSEQYNALEAAIKQSVFDKLSFADKAESHFQKLHGEIQETRTWALGRVEESKNEQVAALEQVRLEVGRRALQTQAEELTDRLSSMAQENDKLASVLAEAEQRLNAADTRLGETLVAQRSDLEAELRVERERATENVSRSVQQLEDKLSEVKRQHVEDVNRIDNDIQVARLDATKIQEMGERHLQVTSAAQAARHDQMNKALSELTRDVQDLDKGQTRRDDNLGRLESIVFEMDARRRPWSVEAQARMRSVSPGSRGTRAQTQRGAENAAYSSTAELSVTENTQVPFGYDQHDELSNRSVRFEDGVRPHANGQMSSGGPGRPRMPTAPAMPARPGSSLGFRRRADQEFGQSVATANQVTARPASSNAPAGPALSIARATRLPVAH